ncbi:MAG: 2-oxo acid dehydrogenase subunit E2 [Anaerolineae bacterium]|nr:2-oxo acid dehydrogenase subunit E2 [Anaerolineae bacterium]
MPYEIVMPRLGWTMEEGTLVEWLKQDGDTINVGDIIFTVESDKAVNEIEAMEGGILRIPPDSPPPGTVMPIGRLLAYILQPGEAVPFGAAAAPSSAAAVSAAPSPVPTPSIASAVVTAPTNGHGNEPTISPRARRIAAELGVDWSALQGSGRTGRIVERDVRAAAESMPAAQVQTESQAVKASPLARRMAQDLDVDLAQLATNLPGKRISRADVAAASQPAPSAAPSTAQPVSEDDQLIPISAVRRITAERMSASAHTVAPVTLTSEVDATELVKLRKQLKGDAEANKRPIPSYNDLLIKLCAEALAEHPEMNARFHEDQIAISRAVHIGIAVDSERGLLVPVLRDAQNKSVRKIAAETSALIERARAGQLKPDEMRGGTFTITNLGMFGIDAFTPIINLPECAILGVGRIVAKQVVIDADAERVAIRQMMFVSLTFDHRLVDGAQAARFLSRVRQFIEQPYLWLI